NGTAQRKRDAAGRVSRGAPEGEAGALSGTAVASAACAREKADAGLRWPDRLYARLARPRANAAESRSVDRACRKPRWRGDANQPSRHDDTRVGAGRLARADWRYRRPRA